MMRVFTKKNTSRVLYAVGIAAALAGSGIVGFCQKAPAPIVEDKIDICKKQGGQCVSPAKKNDGKCEREKGEATKASPTYDEASCKGQPICGNGVAEPPLETAYNCPEDVHCPDGILQENEKRGYVVDGQYVEKTLRECRKTDPTYCEADCQGKPLPVHQPIASNQDAGAPLPVPTPTTPPPVPTTPPQPTGTILPCGFVGGNRMNVDVVRDFRTALNRSATSALGALGDYNGRVTMSISTTLQSNQVTGAPRAFVQCNPPCSNAGTARAAIDTSGLPSGVTITGATQLPCSIGATISRKKE